MAHRNNKSKKNKSNKNGFKKGILGFNFYGISEEMKKMGVDERIRQESIESLFSFDKTPSTQDMYDRAEQAAFEINEKYGDQFDTILIDGESFFLSSLIHSFTKHGFKVVIPFFKNDKYVGYV